MSPGFRCSLYGRSFPAETGMFSGYAPPMVGFSLLFFLAWPLIFYVCQ